MRKSKILLLILLIIITGLFFAKEKIIGHYRIHELEKVNEATIESAKKESASSKYLEVQFICQAPLQTEANWTLHEESCEEAALLQAYNYEMGLNISKEEANEIILDMIEWQGDHRDLYNEEMKEFIMGYYKLSSEEVILIKNAEIKDIKEIINDGHPVIVPITGEILKNPFYPYPGYHMLTVIGYTEDRIITNDNGTRRGADYSYDQEIFEQAFKDAGGSILYLKLNKN